MANLTAGQTAPDFTLPDQDGNPVTLKLRPGLSGPAIDAMEKRLPCPLPATVRELRATTRRRLPPWR